MSQLEAQLRASVAYYEQKKRRAMSTEAIVKAENGNGHRAIADGLLEFNEEQRALIRDTYANGATDAEFAVLMEVAKARRLNPFTKQIHFVKRPDRERGRDVWSAQASIDGLRALAERSRLYDGQDEPEYEYDDAGKLLRAKVRVYRKDWRRPVVGVADYDEYVQMTRDRVPNTFWKNKPRIMLAKCAEALALRKAFPEDTSGLYCPEELGADAGVPQLSGVPDLPKISPHGEVIDGASYEPVEVADGLVKDIEACDDLKALQGLWKASGMATPAGYETLHPEDRRRVSAAYKRRERQLSKPAKELDEKLSAATEDDL